MDLSNSKPSDSWSQAIFSFHDFLKINRTEEEIIQFVHQLIFDYFPYISCSSFLNTSLNSSSIESMDLRLTSNHQGKNTPIQRSLNKIPNDILDWAIKNRHSRVIPSEHLDVSDKTDISAQIIVPIHILDRNIGIILIEIRTHLDSLPLEKLYFFDMIASQTALAIEVSRSSTDSSYKNFQKSNIDLSSVLESMVDGVIVVNLNSEVILMNRNAEVLLKTERNQPLGNHISETFSSTHSTILEEIITEAFQTGFVLDKETTTNLNKSLSIPIGISASLLFDHEGHKMGVVILCKDISRSKKLTALAESNHLKSQFISTLAHEFKVPLNLVVGSVNLLQEQMIGTLNPKQLKLTQLIHEGGFRLTNLINKLLELSRIELKGNEVEVDSLNLIDIIDNTLLIFMKEIETKKIILLKTIDESISYIYGNYELIQSLLENILSNAIKYSYENKTIELYAGPVRTKKFLNLKSDFIEISITDHGIGMSSEDLEHIFEEFNRGSNKEALAKDGTGLGLTIVKKIIETHQGKIEIKSKLKQGTQITLLLPYDMRTFL